MTVYALHGLTGILGPAKRVTAMSGTRIREREFAGHMVPTDADDNTLILIDFGNNMFALAYGTAAGSVTRGFAGSYFGTTGSIVGLDHNGQPMQYPGRAQADAHPQGNQILLPHVQGTHLDIMEQHVFEDVMQLIELIHSGTATVVTPEHARHVIEIIEAGYRAAETGQTQELTTSF